MFFAGGNILLNLRWKLVKTPDVCKNAGEFIKCRIYRCMLKQQNTENTTIYNYAGWKHEQLLQKICKPELPARG